MVSLSCQAIVSACNRRPSSPAKPRSRILFAFTATGIRLSTAWSLVGRAGSPRIINLDCEDMPHRSIQGKDAVPGRIGAGFFGGTRQAMPEGATTPAKERWLEILEQAANFDLE